MSEEVEAFKKPVGANPRRGAPALSGAVWCVEKEGGHAVMWRDTGIWRTVGAGGWLRPRPAEQGRPAVLTDSALQGPRKHWMGACLYTFVLLCPKQNVCCKANAGQGSGTGIGAWGQGGACR